MPRHTLDKWTYKLKTMDVCITQHKEEDVYIHMVKMHKRMEELFNKYKAMYDTIIADLDTNNIYKQYNWRQGEPSRFWKKNAGQWYSVDVSEGDKEIAVAEYFLLYQIWADFQICENHGNEWLSEKEDWSDMVYETERMHGLIKNSYDTITLYENMAYHEAKQEWMVKDRAWIADQDLKKEHRKTHKHIELPSPTDLESEVEPYPDQPLRDDCIYCTQHWEEMKSTYDRVLQIREVNKQEDIDYRRQQELENNKLRQQRERQARDYQKWSELQDPVCLHCSHCDYDAKDDVDLATHDETESHQEKLRYCKCCEIQCSSEYAYKNHIETTKHKKNAGLVNAGPKVYKCSKCEYETITKANYERHCYSKHKE